MKSKDIITLVVSAVIVVGCLIFAIVMFFPNTFSKPTSQTNTPTTTAPQKKEISTDLIEKNDTTLEQINNLKKYGETNLDNIGRVNPFGPLN